MPARSQRGTRVTAAWRCISAHAVASMGRPLLGLRGQHQAHNAAVAVLALEACGERGIGVPREAIVRGPDTRRAGRRGSI